MEALAQRLAEVAAQATELPADIGDHFFDYEVRAMRGRATAVAVLRELAGEYLNSNGSWLAIPPFAILALADSIEKGYA